MEGSPQGDAVCLRPLGPGLGRCGRPCAAPALPCMRRTCCLREPGGEGLLWSQPREPLVFTYLWLKPGHALVTQRRSPVVTPGRRDMVTRTESVPRSPLLAGCVARGPSPLRHPRHGKATRGSHLLYRGIFHPGFKELGSDRSLPGAGSPRPCKGTSASQGPCSRARAAAPTQTCGCETPKTGVEARSWKILAAQPPGSKQSRNLRRKNPVARSGRGR